MFYENELNFFRNVIERSKIKTVIITKTEIPPKIDMGIREFLYLKSDYEKLFNIFGDDNELQKLWTRFSVTIFLYPYPTLKKKQFS